MFVAVELDIEQSTVRFVYSKNLKPLEKEATLLICKAPRNFLKRYPVFLTDEPIYLYAESDFGLIDFDEPVFSDRLNYSLIYLIAEIFNQEPDDVEQILLNRLSNDIDSLFN